MAVPTYPGEVLAGEALTPTRLQALLKPIFEILNPDTIDGTGAAFAGVGVSNDNIKNLGWRKIKDLAAVRSEFGRQQNFLRPVSFGAGFKFKNPRTMSDRAGAGQTANNLVELSIGRINLVRIYDNIDVVTAFVTVYNTIKGADSRDGAFLFFQGNANGYSELRANANGTGAGPIHLKRSVYTTEDRPFRGKSSGFIKYTLAANVTAVNSTIQNNQWYEIAGS